MTHLHLSTLGQCLISLAKQGIKEPLHRVLRFVEYGAVVPNFQRPISSPNQGGGPKKEFKKEMVQSTEIPINKVKVSFQKSSAILDQINLIQQQPDPDTQDQQNPPPIISSPVDYSTEQQYEDIQKIVSQLSPTEAYLNQELNHMKEFITQIQPHWFGQDYINELKENIQGLQEVIEQCQFSYYQLYSEKKLQQFMQIQVDFFIDNPKLNNPFYLVKLMERYSLNFFEADQCMQLNNRNYSQSEEYLQNLYNSQPSTVEKEDQQE